MNLIFGVIIGYLVGGLFLVASIKNWGWFFDRSRAKSTVMFFGRKGARYVYGGTGIFILVIVTVMVFSMMNG